MKKCSQCGANSLPGLAPDQGLCRYHWDVAAYGQEWADKVVSERIERTTGPVERAFAQMCYDLRLGVMRPDRHGGRLDFYLIDFDLYVEVMANSTERLHSQLESVSGKPVMVLVGVQSVEALRRLLNAMLMQ